MRSQKFINNLRFFLRINRFSAAAITFDTFPCGLKMSKFISLSHSNFKQALKNILILIKLKFFVINLKILLGQFANLKKLHKIATDQRRQFGEKSAHLSKIYISFGKNMSILQSQFRHFSNFQVNI